MPQFCAVLNCGSNSLRDKVSFYRFPSASDPYNLVKIERRELWIKALKRSDLTESKLKNQRVCEKHFITGKPASLEERSHADWVPTLKLGYGEASVDLTESKVESEESTKLSKSDESPFSNLPPALLEHNYCQLLPPALSPLISPNLPSQSEDQGMDPQQQSLPSPPLSPPGGAGVSNSIDPLVCNETLIEEEAIESKDEPEITDMPIPILIAEVKEDEEIKEEDLTTEDTTIIKEEAEVNSEIVIKEEGKEITRETSELENNDTVKEENADFKGAECCVKEEAMEEIVKNNKVAVKKNEDLVKKQAKKAVNHVPRKKKPVENKNLAQEVEDSITRCICGFQHDDGFMICCDKCMVWQHVDCMEIERSNIPEEYLCEKCEPRKVDRMRAVSLQKSKKKLFDEVLKTSAADTPPSSSDQSNSDGENAGGKGHGRRKENRKGSVKKIKASPTPKVSLMGKKKKTPKRETKAAKREEASDVDEEEDSDAEDLRSWITAYEEAITNHYSPELRARVSVLRANGIGQEDRLVGAHSARPKSKLVSAYGQKMLVAACNIQNGAPIVEIRGKYMLAKGGQSPSTKGPERYIFHHQISAPGPLSTDVIVDTSTYGNSARFIRSSCNPNAQIKHCIEKGTLHLYLVSSCPIELREEITLPHRQGSVCAQATKCSLLSNGKRRNRKQILVERSVSRDSTIINNNNYKEVPAKKRSLSSERPISSKALKTSNGTSLSPTTESPVKSLRSKPPVRSSVSANLRRPESKPTTYSTYKP